MPCESTERWRVRMHDACCMGKYPQSVAQDVCVCMCMCVQINPCVHQGKAGLTPATATAVRPIAMVAAVVPPPAAPAGEPNRRVLNVQTHANKTKTQRKNISTTREGWMSALKSSLPPTIYMRCEYTGSHSEAQQHLEQHKCRSAFCGSRLLWPHREENGRRVRGWRRSRRRMCSNRKFRKVQVCVCTQGMRETVQK